MSKKNNLLESIMNYDTDKEQLQTLGNRASNAINSIINILENIEENYDPEVASDLRKRLFLSIKNRDYRKFEKGLENLSENKNEKNKWERKCR